MSETPLNLGELRAALDRAGQPWTMAETTMTRLDETARRHRLGVPLDAGTDADAIEAGFAPAAAASYAAAGDAIGAPASFDLRAVGGIDYSTGVRDQGSCGSCVAFGVIGTMESVARYTLRRPQLSVDLSEAHLFYDLGRATGASCDNGWFPEPASEVARTSGVTFEDYYPYVARTPGVVNPAWPDHKATVTSWRSVTNDAAAMKTAISTQGAIVACLYVFQDFFSYRTGVYRHVTGSLAGGHCVTLIGYDDAAGCWIGKNSWGTGWGDQGYFRIAYGQCGIESWHNVAIDGVAFRTWWADQKITGLFAHDAEANVWAFGEQRGWLRLDGGVAPTALGMLGALSAAKAGQRPVGLFEDGNQIKQLYAW